MPKKISSTADVLDDWASLLAAVAEDATVLPNVEPHRLALEQVHKDMLAAKARRDLHAAAKQEATQEMKALKLKGKDAAIALRGAVKADMGPRSERLVHYNVAPLRKRQPKKKPAGPDPESPAPQGPQAPALGPAAVKEAGPPAPGAMAA